MAQPSHDLEDDLSPGKIIEYYIGSSTKINKLSSELTRSCSFSQNPFLFWEILWSLLNFGIFEQTFYRIKILRYCVNS